MEKEIIIVGIGGSLDKNSSTGAVMSYILGELNSLGAHTIEYKLSDIKLPIYNPTLGIEQGGKELVKLLTDVRRANGFIFASPEYHGTISGAFKNAIDYMEFLCNDEPPYLTNKPSGAIAVGGGESAAVTLHTMVNIIHSLRAISASTNIAINSVDLELSGGEIKNEKIIRRIKRLAAEVYSLAEKLK